MSATTTMVWRPLLEGADAERAQEASAAILAAVEAAEHDDRYGAYSLAGGRAGRALLFSYAGRPELARALGDRALVDLGRVRMGASLFGGFTGVAWSRAHTAGREGRGVEVRRMLAELDEVLVTHVSTAPWRRAFDLVEGLVGFGVYALERLPDLRARMLLRAVAARFDELAEPHAGGLAWRTPAHLVPEHDRTRYPLGYMNLGLAHGVPGVVCVLAAAVREGVAEPRLLEGAVAWVLAQERDAGDGGSAFGYWTAPGVRAVPARTAWCYGEPGIASAILLAARAARRDDWEAAAMRIARRAVARPIERTGVGDAGLCHGAAGLAHLYNRLAHATGNDELHEGARAWIGRTLDMRRPGKGVAGFTAVHATDTGFAERADASLLTGAAGIGLALLAAVTDTEPHWDRMLLLSVAR